MMTFPAEASIRPAQSVIIEWENVLLSDSQRAIQMLRRLMAAVEAWRTRGIPAEGTGNTETEILVVHHDRDVPRARLVETLHASLGPGWEGSLRIIEAGTGDYYQLKNIGAEQAQGDIVIFLDCDVIPEADWLEELLVCFDGPGVEIVSGSSYLESRTLIEKTLALIWFFPLRPEGRGTGIVRDFHANNLAFRRATFLRHPFPVVAGTSRGACEVHARRLREERIPIHRSLGARVCHPAPQGLVGLLRRGIAEGRDRLLQDRSGRPHKAGLRRRIKRSAESCIRDVRVLARDRRSVRLPAALVPPAIVLALTYELCKLLGDLSTRAFPKAMQSRFRI